MSLAFIWINSSYRPVRAQSISLLVLWYDGFFTSQLSIYTILHRIMIGIGTATPETTSSCILRDLKDETVVGRSLRHIGILLHLGEETTTTSRYLRTRMDKALFVYALAAVRRHRCIRPDDDGTNLGTFVSYVRYVYSAQRASKSLMFCAGASLTAWRKTPHLYQNPWCTRLFC